jgi:hypothetical protein
MAGTAEEGAEQQQFVLLVRRLTESSDAAERERLKEELARMTFGEQSGPRARVRPMKRL